MAHLFERRFLECPYVGAQSYLSEALREAAGSGEQQTLRLHVASTDFHLEKDVLVRYGRGSDPMHFDEPWTIAWTPAGGGPYPDFDGTLTVRAGEDYPTSSLELEGEYRPPFGGAGRAFDAVVGHRIATNTAQTLLKTIGDRMEERYRTEEARKPR